MKDYTNKICGCWHVKERDFNPKSKSHETFWIAECINCGNVSSIRKTDLDKQPKSCNHCKGRDLRSWKIGDKYGEEKKNFRYRKSEINVKRTIVTRMK